MTPMTDIILSKSIELITEILSQSADLNKLQILYIKSVENRLLLIAWSLIMVFLALICASSQLSKIIKIIGKKDKNHDL
jgi:hypothetical protein